MNTRVWVLDSITQLEDKHYNQVVIAGSHGGLYCGWYAAQKGLRGVILHDAGVGLEHAGISCLTLLNQAGIAGATVNYKTARIGDGNDLLSRGKISFCNTIGSTLGIELNMPVAFAAQRFRLATRSIETVQLQHESRVQLSADNGQGIEVIGIDSNSLVCAQDANNIVITGSHGALLGGKSASAIKVSVLGAVYNDAGGGIDDSGYSRLPALDARGIPAMTVHHTSARIGDANSTWKTGILSRANAVAANLGICIGMSVPEAVSHIRYKK